MVFLGTRKKYFDYFMMRHDNQPLTTFHYVNDKIKTVYLFQYKKQVEYELLVIFFGAWSVWRLTACYDDS